LSIDSDHARFRQIIKGKIKNDLRRFMSQGEMIGKQGKKLVSIPLPQIDLPHYRHDSKKKGGVGQGPGEKGTPIGKGDEEAGEGEAGNMPGQHLLEVDLTLEELADIMGEELELPRIEPKGNKNIESLRYRFTGINRVGPESLRHFRRTFKEALRREISSGNYDPENPMIIPIREDRRYRTFKEVRQPENSAVIIYMMDVSGSMGEEQKEIVRLESFWIDTWLRANYKGIETRFIIHDAIAREVDRETFFRTRESGGTIISSAYKLCLQMIHEKYDPSVWNIYPFHFSDGDNWSGNDTNECLELLELDIMPACNVFCYGQVESEYGSGQFIKDLNERFGSSETLLTSRIDNREAIYDSIKTFLGKGK
jgi:hypothetical protein